MGMFASGYSYPFQPTQNEEKEMEPEIDWKNLKTFNGHLNIDKKGREVIHEWSRKRIQKMKGLNRSYYGCLVYTFHLSTLKSFVENFNFMVIIQMFIAAVGVYLFDRYDIHYGFSASLFVSPIVFPLAFSINTDFQRREKVLDDLANFKSSSMLWFFCMREWHEGAALDDKWMEAIKRKTQSMIFNAREYLLTSRKDRRNVIASFMYEDYSDISQLIEKLRASKLPQNPALISRAYHLLNGLCLSFERLRVIREYRSPRSIRSFNKVLVLLLPIMLCPYFVSLSRSQGVNQWGPYFIAVLVAGVFGALQGVQDKLDDPFDGMSEDDIKLDTLDEWTLDSLELLSKRNYTCSSEYNYDTEERKLRQGQKMKHSKRSPNGKEFRPNHIVDLLKEMQYNEAMKYRQLRKKEFRERIVKDINNKSQHEHEALLLTNLNDDKFNYQNPSKIRNKMQSKRQTVFGGDTGTEQQDSCTINFPEMMSEGGYDVIQNGNVSMDDSSFEKNNKDTPPLIQCNRKNGNRKSSQSQRRSNSSQDVNEDYTIITIIDSPENDKKSMSE